MTTAPPVILDEQPRLPRLRLRYFYPGLVVRLCRPLADVEGIEVPIGQRLRLTKLGIQGRPGAALYQLDFEECSFLLDPRPQDDKSVIGNGGNSWFQPVPERDALEALWELLETRLYEAELGEADPIDAGMLAVLRQDLEQAGDWLQQVLDGPPPHLSGAPVAAEFFGKGSDMAVWFELLFLAIPHCSPAAPLPAEAAGALARS